MGDGQSFILFGWGVFILIGILSWFVWDKRYRNGRVENIPPGYLRTDEVFIDPVNGKKQRVYYNSETGERLYRDE